MSLYIVTVSLTFILLASSCGLFDREPEEDPLKEELTEREYARLQDAREFVDAVDPLHDIELHEDSSKIQVAVSELAEPVIFRIPVASLSEVMSVELSVEQAGLERILAPSADYFWNDPLNELIVMIRPIGVYMIDSPARYSLTISGSGKDYDGDGNEFRVQSEYRDFEFYWQPMQKNDETDVLTYKYSADPVSEQIDLLLDSDLERLRHELSTTNLDRYPEEYREKLEKIRDEIYE
ncbi:hypothetical protein CKO08_01445 [Halorhodospira halochloris]|nr:hypothetical protein [Halorhodospira halochloris]